MKVIFYYFRRPYKQGAQIEREKKKKIFLPSTFFWLSYCYYITSWSWNLTSRGRGVTQLGGQGEGRWDVAKKKVTWGERGGRWANPIF